MRIDGRLEIIQKALDTSGTLRIEVTQRYNGQAYQIDNWQDLRAALKELLRQNWAPNSQLIQDFVEVEGDEDTPLLETQRYEELASAISQLNSGIPVAIGTMSSLITKGGQNRIYVELGDVGTPNELQAAIGEIVELFNVLSADKSFGFGGFAHGSEWLSWLPLSELTEAVTILAIFVAKEWGTILGKKSKEKLIREAKAWNRAKGDKDTEPDDEAIEKFQEALAEDELVPLWEGIKEYLGDLPEPQRNEVINRIRMGAKQAQQQMQKGRTFEVSSNSPVIIINGDNNSTSITINGDTKFNIADKEVLQLTSPDGDGCDKADD